MKGKKQSVSQIDLMSVVCGSDLSLVVHFALTESGNKLLLGLLSNGLELELCSDFEVAQRAPLDDRCNEERPDSLHQEPWYHCTHRMTSW